MIIIANALRFRHVPLHKPKGDDIEMAKYQNGNLSRLGQYAGGITVLGAVFFFFVRLEATVQQVDDLQRSNLQNRMTTIETRMTEIETQFCEGDNVRNLIHSYDLRIEAMLWNKAFKSPLPISQAFYPAIGRCQTEAITTSH